MNYHLVPTKKIRIFESVFLVSEVPDPGTFFFFSPTLKNFLHFYLQIYYYNIPL